jgi:hypothetical protein
LRFWTSYWKEENLLRDEEHVPLRASGGRLGKGASSGDALYVVSLHVRQLVLVGRLTLDRIVSHKEAMLILKHDDLPGAADWAIAKDGSGTLVQHRRQLAPQITRQLQFKGTNPRLKFVSQDCLDTQTLRSPRELTWESAALLDEIIEMTDGKNRTKSPVTISDDQLQEYRGQRILSLKK